MIKTTRTISITSGKGGVGKSTLTCNLALRLAQLGRKVLILDGDLGMANVDIMFDVRVKGNLSEVLMGEKNLHDIVTPAAKDIDLISGGSGLVHLNQLNHFERRALLEGVSLLPQHYDYLLIDTAPGIADNVLFLNSAVESILVVLTPDPASFADSYALIKVLANQHRIKSFQIVCNFVRDDQEGRDLFSRFQDVVLRFLNVRLEFAASIPLDSILRTSTQKQRLILRQDANAESAKAIRLLGSNLDRHFYAQNSNSGMRVFWEQVMGEVC